MEDRIGERGEPCGVLWFKTTSGSGLPLNDRETHLSMRNDWTHSHGNGENPRRVNKWTRQSI